MNTTQALPAPPPYRLWLATLAEPPADDDAGLLSRTERARAERFVFERDRRRYVAAHAALRRTLAQELGEAPQALRFETDRFGKPWLDHAAPWAFSLSRCGDLAVIALAPQGAIGVDLELLREVPDGEALAAQHFGVAERAEWRALPPAQRAAALLRCWTRKEACLKAIGSGLSVPPQQVDAGIGGARRDVSVVTEAGPVGLVVESLPEVEGRLIALARVVARS